MKRILDNRYRIIRTLLKGETVTAYLCEDLRVHNAKRVVQEMNCSREEALALCQGEDVGLPIVTDLFVSSGRQHVVMDWEECVSLDDYTGPRGDRLYKEGFRLLAAAGRLALEACPTKLGVTPSGQVRLRFRLSRDFKVSVGRPAANWLQVAELLRTLKNLLFWSTRALV